MNDTLRLLPEQASTTASDVDALALGIFLITAIFSIGIGVAIVVLVIRYWHGRRVNRKKGSSARNNWPVELVWSVGPLLIVLGLFGWGSVIYFKDQHPPREALDVYVVGKQWMWKIGHAGGRREIDTLHVPAGRDVRLTMISEDVIHSFFVPAFRTKQDVLPGRFTQIWFRPSKPGRYHLFCAEYCGTSHSQMIGKVVVQAPDDYADWVAAGDAPTPEQSGLRLLDSLGCLQCHGQGGKPTGGSGPSLVGLFGSRVLLNDGSTVVADAEYIRRSIVDPNSQLVSGFERKMPSFEGEIDPEQLLQILAYLRSVADATGPMAGPTASLEE